MDQRLLVVGMSHDVWPPLLYRVSGKLREQGWHVTHLYSAAVAQTRALADSGSDEAIVVDCPPLSAATMYATVRRIRRAVAQQVAAHPPTLVVAHHAASLPAVCGLPGARPLVYLASDLYDLNTPRMV